MLLKRLALVLTCALGISVIAGSITVRDAAVPEFAVVIKASGRLRVYSPPAETQSNGYTVADSVLSATVATVAPQRWTLTLQARQELSTVVFPWQSQRAPLDDAIDDDIYYYPTYLGRSEKARARDTDWAWFGGLYPGLSSAPLVVMADHDNAKIVAATNWPPRAVTAAYAAQRLILRYDEVVPVDAARTYAALIADVAGDTAAGTPPWIEALDIYKSWLRAHVLPLRHPEWMWNVHGFFGVSLAHHGQDLPRVERIWSQRKARFPWILFWGQMSEPGGSCCTLAQPFEPTRRSAVVNLVRMAVRNGYHAGYYASPYYGTGANDPPRLLDSEEGLSWLRSWLALNRAHAADSFYIDTLGRRYYGDPSKILDLFVQEHIPPASLVEGAVDIYPAATLVSGALVGDRSACGAPQKTPENATVTTFPRFIRYLLSDRMMFWGETNTDWRFWGNARAWEMPDPEGINQACGYASYCASNGPCEHGTERQAFLLGAKLDVWSPLNNWLPGGGSDHNPILDAIVSERERVGWWKRRPAYQDTKGLVLTGIPSNTGIAITRFRAANSADLIAISNPKALDGYAFAIDGTPVAVPPRPIAIVERYSQSF